MTAFYTITNGTTVPADGYFSIPGNFTAMFTGGFEFVAVDSGTGSPMVSSYTTFTVSSSAYVSGQTQITPDLTGSPTPSLTPAGQWITMMGGAYTINFSDTAASPNSFPIIPGAIDSTTDLKLPGRAVFNYGEILNENLLHLLENFASPTAPTQPIEGQLWYEKSVGLNVYNGVSFVPTAVSGINLFDLVDVTYTGSPELSIGDVLTWTGSSWDAQTPGIENGVAYDEIIITGSPIPSVVNTTNVNTTANTGTTSYQQVFRNGILQREGGTYTVTGANQITFTVTLNDLDEILIYSL